jgi:tRNA threonylcarbamoyladenosine biosynthesis protein TsaE
MENSPVEELFFTASARETAALGERVGRTLQAGAVVALRGGLGAGKTCFVKGLARALGVRGEVTSPTYTIVSEYDGRLPLYHVDAYRLSGDDDFAALGAQEFLYGAGVSVIEWSERVAASLPAFAITVEMSIMEDDKRAIKITSPNGEKV